MAGILLARKNSQQYFKHIFLVLTAVLANKSNSKLGNTTHTNTLKSTLTLLLEQKTKAYLQLSATFITCMKRKVREGNLWVSLANSISKLLAA